MKIILALMAALAAGNLEGMATLDEGYRQMYNLQFEQAHRTFMEYRQTQPADPLGPVSDAAAYLFSEFHRLRILQSEFFVDNDQWFALRKPAADPEIKQRFESDLEAAKRLAYLKLQASPQDGDAQFANALRFGLRADYLALLEKKNLAALAEIKEGRQRAERLLLQNPRYYDAYLAIGVENYLLSIKPAPVRWFLHLNGAKTDKQAGIENLRLTAEHGRYLLPYARLLLAVAALRDGDRGQARQLLSELANQFPANPLYREELAKIGK